MARPTKASSEIVGNLISRFDISKYQGCARFSLFEWVNALQSRHNVWESDPEFDEIWPGSHALDKEFAERLIEDPLEVGRHQISHADAYDQAVEGTTLWDASQIARMLESLRPRLEREQKPQEGKEHPTSFDSAPTWSLRCFDELILDSGGNEGLILAGTAYVTVNLCATDEEIMRSFRSWLKGKRRSTSKSGLEGPKAKRYSEQSAIEWTEKKVLPYLDLKLISRAHGVEMTNYRIGELLFKEETDVDIAEKIRKVVKPCAEHLMNNVELFAIYYSAVQLLRTG